MANDTADIEQLLAELVRLTTKIATLTNETRNKDDDDSDSLTSTANRLALSATIIAVAAFVISAFQAVLEYASADEPARRRCNRGAIGPFSKYVRKKWSFRSWRRKFYYPEVSIQLEASRSRDGGDGSPARNGNQFLTGWTQKFKGMMNTTEDTNRDSILRTRPRATWAQFLVWDDGNLGATLMTGRYIDVDCVPSSLDVPIQMVNLIQLGRLSILMGYDAVKMNFRDRSFNVTGEMGTITIEELVGFGKAVRYQGNGFNRHKGIDLSSSWVRDSSLLIDGIFDTPNSLLENADMREAYIRHTLSVLRSEASRMRSALNRLVNNHDDKCLDGSYDSVSAMQVADTDAAFSQSRVSSDYFRYPNILVTLSIAAFPRGKAGFPARLLLIPFLGQCRRMSQAISEKYRSAEGEGIITSFADILGHIKRDASDRPSHWKSKCIFGFSWSAFDIANAQHEEPVSRRRKVIIPVVSELFKDYDPRLWARSLQRNPDRSNLLSPNFVLIAQLVLLDHFIYRSLRFLQKASILKPLLSDTCSRHDARRALPREFIDDVLAAIAEAGRRESEEDLPLFHNLERMLLRNLKNVDIERTAEPCHRHHISQIANLLKMRVLVYAAYLMIIPDSSDIIEAQDATGCKGFILPMI